MDGRVVGLADQYSDAQSEFIEQAILNSFPGIIFLIFIVFTLYFCLSVLDIIQCWARWMGVNIQAHYAFYYVFLTT